MTARRALALLAALSLLLVGCSDDPEPKMPDPPATSSATPTEEPTETQTPEAESAEDFIRRWVDLDRQMQNSGDVDAYLAVSARCETCVAVAEQVEGYYEAGGYLETDGLTIKRIDDRSGDKGRRVFDVAVSSAPTALKESAESKVQRFPGGDVVYRMRLTASSPWRLVDLTQLAS